MVLLDGLVSRAQTADETAAETTPAQTPRFGERLREMLPGAIGNVDSLVEAAKENGLNGFSGKSLVAEFPPSVLLSLTDDGAADRLRSQSLFALDVLTLLLASPVEKMKNNSTHDSSVIGV